MSLVVMGLSHHTSPIDVLERVALDAAGAQALPETLRGLAEAAQPVVDEPHAHAFPRLREQRVGESRARIVLADDVALEVDMAPGRPDCGEPCRIVLARVPQQPDVVAVDEQRAGGARERPVGDRAHFGHGVWRWPHECFPFLPCAASRAPAIALRALREMAIQ